jgi:hypothetical protein
MEVNQLTDEQIKTLTPEEIETLETNPEKLEEILSTKGGASETATDKPEQGEQEGAANGAGEGEPVVLTKNGKGTIPYEKHKALRVENSALRQELQEVNTKLGDLLKQRDEAGTKKEAAAADDAIAKHLERLKSEMPEVHEVISAVLEGSRKQGEELSKTLDELKREREESQRAKQLTVDEQIAEAKENNPDLVHWEGNDPEAWDEALRQDEILRTSGKWAGKPFADRFEEVVRRVRAILPDASVPNKPADPEKTKADAKAKVEKAPARKPTTLSDIQGGANPASEREQLENLSPHELARRLMKMPSQQAAALRAELD